MIDPVWYGRERLWAAAVTTGVVGAALVPLRQYLREFDDRVDGFPLSYFPMFSVVRGQFDSVIYVVGVRADGHRHQLPYNALGTGGVNQVRKQASRAARRGRAERHVRLIAERVARMPEFGDVVRVEMVHGTFDLDRCLLDRKVVPEGEEVLAGADVHRASPAAEPAGLT